ncbi:MAG: pilus assembly protein TadA [Rickettsiales bacterium]|nr:pilus assembly protein TadA [Rickettsiales bacterium]
MIRIVYVDPESQREVVADLEGERIRIGREGGNELVLPYMEVSRFHAEVSGSEQGVVLTDRSTNGTFVNGQRVFGKQLLQLGDQVTIGNCVLHVYTEAQVRQIQAGQAAQAAAVPYAPEVYQQPGYSAEAAAATGAMGAISDSPAGPAVLEPTASARGGVAPVDLKRRVHRRLLQYMDLKSMDMNKVGEGELRKRARDLLIDIISELENDISPDVDRDLLVKEVLDEALGLGPLEDLLDDDSVTEIMVVSKDQIYVERDGRIEFTGCTFTAHEAVLAVIERIITPLGRRIDESSPLVDARLKDGSRVNAIIPPLAIKGPCITIRKFGKKSLTMQDLVGWGSVTEQIAGFLEKCVLGRKNIIISGGTGSGKTTLLNCLSSFIPSDERIVTIEDAAELRLPQEHVVSLETKPANLEGKGAYSIRELVKNSLRMRPDRIVVGECRGGEALDMLQAMNTGHDGSLTTGHANSPTDMISRLETMVLMAGMDLPVRAIRDQICAAVDVIVQQTRFSDGTRRVVNVTEVVGLEDDGRIHLEDIFRFQQRGVDEGGRIQGEVLLTGYIPTFIPDLINSGIVKDGSFL